MILGILGSKGRIGSRIMALAERDPDIEFLFPISHTDLHRKREEAFSQSDILIDFSSPLGTARNLSDAKFFKKPLVLGTTGLNSSDHVLLEQASKEIPILYSSNFSSSIALLISFAPLISKHLGDRFSVKIIETHHRHKKDSPSGTALALGKAVGGNPSIESFREGDIIGEHTLIFSSEIEELTVHHKALSRDLFAQGALNAAKSLRIKDPGLYSLNDLI